MTYPEYRADLQRIHASEVYGAAVFRTAAAWTRDPARKAKWRTLQALEDQTLARYLQHMRATGEPVTEPTGWALRGRAEGVALGLMPWRLAMKLLAHATQPFLTCFQRLEEHALGEERAFFAYVCAHEEAIQTFARKELAHDAGSLGAVEALLDR